MKDIDRSMVRISALRKFRVGHENQNLPTIVTLYNSCFYYTRL